MSEFVKPVRQKVDVSEGFAELLGKKLTKDLHDNEAICPKCHGTGMRLTDNPYGLSNDPDRRIGPGMFPYKHQSIIFCDNCYNGVVRICPDCGKQLPRSKLTCNCAAANARKYEERRKKYQQTLDAAEKHEPNALGTTFQMCYSDYLTSHNEGYFGDWEEFFENWEMCWGKDEPRERPQYVWGTDPLPLTLDAHNILESATEDLYEGAMDDIGDAGIAALQQLLNEWKAKYGCGDTYYQTNKHAVRIPWEQYDKEGEQNGEKA